MDVINSYRELKTDLTKHLDRLETKVETLAEDVSTGLHERKAIRLEIQTLRDIVNSYAPQKVTVNLYSIIQNPMIILAVIVLMMGLILGDVIGSTSVSSILKEKVPSFGK